MSTVCEHCKGQILDTDKNCLNLMGGKKLCAKCAKPIYNKVLSLVNAGSEYSFNAASEEILTKAKALYSDEIVQNISTLIEKLRSRSTYKKYEAAAAKAEEEAAAKAEERAVAEANNTAGMFANIGEKLKTFATVVTVLGIVASVSVGIYIFAQFGEAAVGPGLMVLVFGPLFSWLSSLSIYGIGRAVVTSEENNRLLKEIKEKLK